MKHSKGLNFTDDTVIYTSKKTSNQLEHDLNEELKNILDIAENELVIKPGKTKSIVFGTQKSLSKYESVVNLKFFQKLINSTAEYKVPWNDFGSGPFNEQTV